MGGHDAESRLDAMEARVSELEHRLRALAACVDELAAALALGRGAKQPDASQNKQELTIAQAAFGNINTDKLPAGLRAVIELVQQGQVNQAQRDLYNLPETILHEHQDVVTMIATALFIQRGDLVSAKKILSSAVQATNDSRLRKLLAIVEQHCPA